MKDYLVIYEQADDGAWGAHSPDVEGVVALGETEKRQRLAWQRPWRRTSRTCGSPAGPSPEPRTHAGHVAA
jgi:hypothetical protein